MHPLLLEIPLPRWPIPLALVLAALGVAGLLVAVASRRRRAADRVALGGVLAFVGVVGALALRGLAFTPGSVVVTTYGALLAVAIVAGWIMVSDLGRSDGLAPRSLAEASFAAVAGGLVGARVDYLIQAPPADLTLARALDLGGGGLALQGALWLGALAAAGLLWRRRLAFLPFADVAAPAVALGLLLGRLGSYATGGGFGRPLGAEAPRLLAVLGTFPRWDTATLGGHGAPAWVAHVSGGLVPAAAQASLPVHPTQLYLALAAAVALGVAIAARRRRRFAGEVLLATALAESALRYPIDLLRDDPDRWLVGPRLAAAHGLGFGLVLVAIAYVLGPSSTHRIARTRWLRQGAALLVAGLVWGAVAAANSGRFTVALSLGQWGALATVLAVAAAWGPLSRRGARDGSSEPVDCRDKSST